jgi:hypothetical protein
VTALAVGTVLRPLLDFRIFGQVEPPSSQFIANYSWIYIQQTQDDNLTSAFIYKIRLYQVSYDQLAEVSYDQLAEPKTANARTSHRDFCN